ncbi:MAG: DUF4102 domain-containing protein, partial [Leptolyngbya sp.]|nr:DUF4102 domain-containing protein [Candidatus Melainabacteria bacterium]
MPTAITTDRQVLALKSTGVQYRVRVQGTPGLTIRVSQAGMKTFELRYRGLDGKQRRFGLGEYPALSLATAIKKAGIYRNVIA